MASSEGNLKKLAPEIQGVETLRVRPTSFPQAMARMDERFFSEMDSIEESLRLLKLKVKDLKNGPEKDGFLNAIKAIEIQKFSLVDPIGQIDSEFDQNFAPTF
eukprot:CAMPEP_0171454382 /NCGR_PEP_ID=MMETSP0945-20130129/1687_1 /TAXON_ID=109269 /ORGANISM="Vaucheria litorea, Strain CCMP2940" /LENGTH=102 /DNA_ID=CAMNT_0011979387 /DNA_START=183 /DNA_END=491 /DNA_ORIENTATION=+